MSDPSRWGAGVSLADASGFVKSPECQATYGALNDPQFVIQLYQNVLDRSPTAAEVTYHANRLQSGASRVDLVVGFRTWTRASRASRGFVSGFTNRWSTSLRTLPLLDDDIAVADAGFLLARRWSPDPAISRNCRFGRPAGESATPTAND